MIPVFYNWKIKIKHWILVSQFSCRVFLVKQIMVQIPSLKIGDLPPSGELANLCCEGPTRKQLLASAHWKNPILKFTPGKKTVLHTLI
jgi:hypothetical protein